MGSAESAVSVNMQAGLGTWTPRDYLAFSLYHEWPRPQRGGRRSPPSSNGAKEKSSQAPEDPGIQEAMTETREQVQIKLRWQESLLIWTHLGYLAVCLIII